MLVAGLVGFIWISVWIPRFIAARRSELTDPIRKAKAHAVIDSKIYRYTMHTLALGSLAIALFGAVQLLANI